MTHTGWDAKLRVGGDFVDSGFIEIQGEKAVQILLSQHVPGTLLQDLRVVADLETVRSAWTVECRPNARNETLGRKLSIVVDHVVAVTTQDFQGYSSTFQHEVGEVEVMETIDTATGLDEDIEKRKLLQEHMHAQIKSFMKSYSELFSTSKPIGKLSAYFAWRNRHIAKPSSQRQD